jgi:hypothetical protein
MYYGIKFHDCGIDSVFDESCWGSTNAEATVKLYQYMTAQREQYYLHEQSILLAVRLFGGPFNKSHRLEHCEHRVDCLPPCLTIG